MGVKPASRKAASGQLTEADVMQAISNAGELGCCRSAHCVGSPCCAPDGCKTQHAQIRLFPSLCAIQETAASLGHTQ